MPVRQSSAAGAILIVDEHPALPGEFAADPSLVDEVVETLNAMYRVKALEAAREVGEYLLDRFFDGDPVRFRERGRKHASFRKLADREDLQPSYSFLWHACAVVDQLRQLPEELRDALPLSHHRLLLPVHDPEAKVDLARRAVDEGMSKRVFEDEIRRSRGDGQGASRVGRPPLPAVVKGLNRVRSAVREVADVPVDDGMLTAERARELLVDIAGQIQVLMAVKDRIEGVLGEIDE
jgi:hypothetical protein